MKIDSSNITEEMKKYKDFLVETRRTLHRKPELGLEEKHTAAYIGSLLDSMGIEYILRGTAITAIVRGKSESPCVALRADIDGLPLNEETGLEFSSVLSGKMHACGHDAHAAILLGAARWFSENRENLKGTVKFFFQPAEETEGGAQTMIENGDLDNPYVDRVFGLHVMPYMKPGFIEVKKGALNGSSTNLEITVKGTSGHGAYPESAVDAIMAAAQVITGAHTLVSRRVSPLEQAVISFGVIKGGEAGNIIADEVTIKGTMRTCNDTIRDRLIEQLREMVDLTCRAHGAEGHLDISYGYAALINHGEETDRVVRVAENTDGIKSILWKEQPSMGVEDFSFFLKERPGAFFHLGCGPAEGTAYPLHSSKFILDEECLPLGAALQISLVLDVFNGD